MENQKEIKVALIIIVVMIVVASIIGKLALMKADRLQAEYEARFHTIYFDTAGGKIISPIEADSLWDASNIRAEKEGYIFTGWLLNGQPIDYWEELTHDVTVTASYRDPRHTKEQLSSATKIDYVSLFKGEETLRYNFYNITGEIVQDAGDNIYHVDMTKKSSYYTDRIQIEVKGKPSEIIMVGDIISFTGQYQGNYSYTTVLLTDNKIPHFTVYAENLKVVGHTNY